MKRFTLEMRTSMCYTEPKCYTRGVRKCEFQTELSNASTAQNDKVSRFFLIVPPYEIYRLESYDCDQLHTTFVST